MTDLNETQLPVEEAQPVKKGRKNKKEKPKKTFWQEVLSWVGTLALAMVIALVIRTFIFEPIRVDGSSMADTLHNGELTFTLKTEYLFSDPDRFDVVICHYPDRVNTQNPLGIELETNFVKRVIGLPGEVIEIRNSVVYINGEPLEEDFLTPARNTGRVCAYMPPIQLGEDEYFMMGDNRDNSNDSRNLLNVGPITRDMIVGEVKFVFFPFSAVRGI